MLLKEEGSRGTSAKLSSPCSALTAMIRVCMMSGEELVSASIEEVGDAKGLKSLLRSWSGFPVCLQQLLHHGSSLDDDTMLLLHVPMDLQLVLLSMIQPAQQYEAHCELAAACEDGDAQVVQRLLEAGAQVDLQYAMFANPSGLGEIEFGTTPLMVAAENGHTEIIGLLLEAGANKDLQNLGCS